MGGTETNTVWVNQSSGSTLTFSSGGLIKSGTNDANISGGSLTSTSGELDVSVTGGNLNISSSLVGNFVLTERGAGTLILSGNPANTYTGFTPRQRQPRPFLNDRPYHPGRSDHRRRHCSFTGRLSAHEHVQRRH